VNAVHQCWTQKAARMAPDQLPAARALYDRAEQVYQKRKAESD
jgi:hypothetical protein